MKEARSSPGLIYCTLSNLNSILVFGGYGTSYVGMKTCESYSLERNLWEIDPGMPDMNETRSYFNPCIYNLQIYLIGGHTKSTEVYTPQTNTFHLISTQLPEKGRCYSTILDTELIIITRSYVLKACIDDEGTIVENRPRLTGSFNTGDSRGLSRLGNRLYLWGNGDCTWYDLNDGHKIGEASL
jgi:hypothetical protein